MVDLLSSQFASELQSLSRLAGEVIMAHRTASSLNTKRKPDGSQVTDADKDSERVIIEGLLSLASHIPIVAEEKDNPQHLVSSKTYWLVDPLDGTKNYVEGGDEFSVNIGLIVEGNPYLGVIYAPAKNDLFYGDPFNAVRINNNISSPLIKQQFIEHEKKHLITSRREVNKLPLEKWRREGHVDSWQACSSAYKFGLLAAGEADIFLRTGVTYEWDTAAGDAILRSVGGNIVTNDGNPLNYGKPDFRNGNFIAYKQANTASLASTLFSMLEKLNQ